MVQVLVEAGARVDATSNGVTSAHVPGGAVCDALTLCLCLPSLDPHVFAQGSTPLDYAVYNNKLDASIALARAGGKLLTQAKSDKVWCLPRVPPCFPIFAPSPVPPSSP